jgi:hypothetical protein
VALAAGTVADPHRPHRDRHRHHRGVGRPVTDDFTPSVFTPFFRRFTDERARDTSDTLALYRRVCSLHAASPYASEQAITNFADLVMEEVLLPSENLVPVFKECLWKVLLRENVIFECPDIDIAGAHLSLKEQVDLRHYLRAKEHFHANEKRIGRMLFETMVVVCTEISSALPDSRGPSPFSIPLIFAVPEPKALIQGLLGEMWKEPYADAGLFVDLSRKLWRNTCAVSGIHNPDDPKKAPKLPLDNPAPLHQIVDDYFGGTPFRELFLTPVPLQLSHEDRFSHMHVLGGSGAGKTQLLQNLILHDLQSEDRPSLVIVDSQGDLIDKLLHLKLFDPNDANSLAEKLVLITPKDVKYPPAINIFDVNRNRLNAYDEATKEQVVAGVIQTFDYLFAGLLGADLTAKQGVFFRFVARLMLALPETLGRNATILDMLALMDDPAPYKEAIASLPPIQRAFFKRDFPSKTFAQTREQIRYRLNAILENPTLARLFTAPDNYVDIFELINDGGIILIDTAKDFLKGSSGHFGRIFISLALQAVLERAAIPEGKRKSTFLVVDEAAAYFDSNIDDFLTEARKYRCGCVFAHQFLDQATSSLRASLAANTAIKFAGGVSTGDARSIAKDMRTTAEFILDQPRLHFASFIRGVTPSAVSIPVSVGNLERMSRLSDAEFDWLRKLNRAKIAASERVGSTGGGFAHDDHRRHASHVQEQRNSQSRREDSSAGGGKDARPPDVEQIDPGVTSQDW